MGKAEVPGSSSVESDVRDHNSTVSLCSETEQNAEQEISRQQSISRTLHFCICCRGLLTVLSDQKIQKVARDATKHPRLGFAVLALVSDFFMNAMV